MSYNVCYVEWIGNVSDVNKSGPNVVNVHVTPELLHPQ